MKPMNGSTGPAWVKSSLSFANGNCLEVAEWHKSSLSMNNGNSVEAADLGEGMVAVRDSKNPEVGPLVFTRDEWEAFIGGVHNGEFDRFGRSGA